MPEESNFNDNIDHQEIRDLYTSNLERSEDVCSKLKQHNKIAKVEFLTQLQLELAAENKD